MAIDLKYGKVVFEHGNIGEDEPIFVFRAQDMLVPALLGEYYRLCVETDRPAHHLKAITESIGRIKVWQEQHDKEGRMTNSDTYSERLAQESSTQ